MLSLNLELCYLLLQPKIKYTASNQLELHFEDRYIIFSWQVSNVHSKTLIFYHFLVLINCESQSCKTKVKSLTCKFKGSPLNLTLRLKWLQPTCRFGDRTEVYTTKTSLTDSTKPHLKYFEKALLGDGGWICCNLYTY